MKNKPSVLIMMLLIFNTIMYYIELTHLYITKLFKNES